MRNHRDKEYSNTSLLVYGNGDGGGGPLASMIERLRRMKNVVCVDYFHMYSNDMLISNTT